MKDLQSKKDIFTIPNLLSVFRMVLAVVMLWVFYSPEVKEKDGNYYYITNLRTDRLSGW